MRDTFFHVYFVPGMAADVSIFEFIQLPKEKFMVYKLPWKIPKDKESLQDYAKRMCEEIEHKKCILVGVSFGGVVVQEMSRFLDCKKVIIVSSVKTKYELPSRMQWVRRFKLYKVFPTYIISKIDNWEKLAIGDFAKKRAALYQKYLSVNDKKYLDWSIKNMVQWNRKEVLKNLVHIHGNKDIVFPIKNIQDCILIEGGTHVMIINRAKWFNENLPEILMQDLH